MAECYPRDLEMMCVLFLDLVEFSDQSRERNISECRCYRDLGVGNSYLGLSLGYVPSPIREIVVL